MGGVQETTIVVGPSWTAMRLVGAEAAVIRTSMKTFSKNVEGYVEGCRDGSAKNHRNQV